MRPEGEIASAKGRGAMIMKTVLITGSIAFVGVLCVVLLTLFGPNTVASQYVKFAIMMVLFLAILVGSYWFVMVPPGGERQERERQEGETER
jgi:predicted membrane-bound spermidine synthase